MRRNLNSALPIALTANLLEWYEFAISGLMALTIGKLFFPASGDTAALIASFSVFATSYLARPIGSVFFGIWAEKRGARAALTLSLILMAVPTALIAFLPTYETAGYLATGVLIVLKILHGFAAGGELPISAYYVSLNTSEKNRGFYCSLVSLSTLLGVLLASVVVLVLPSLASKISAMFPGGVITGHLGEVWRWPFLLSIPLSLWVLWIRASMPVTIVDKLLTPRISLTKPVAPLMQAAVLVAFLQMHFYTVFFWLPNYLHSYLGVSNQDAHQTNLIGLTVLAISIFCTGYATRRISASRLLLTGIIGLLVSSYPLFAVLQSGTYWSLLFAQSAFAVMDGLIYGTIFIVLAGLFEENWKSLGMTIGFTVPTAIFGGTAPVVCTYLIKWLDILAAPALYLMAMGLLAAPVAYHLAFRAKNQKRRPEKYRVEVESQRLEPQ
jgi:MHS family proline/betaine transporter-like MFS transporter